MARELVVGGWSVESDRGCPGVVGRDRLVGRDA